MNLFFTKISFMWKPSSMVFLILLVDVGDQRSLCMVIDQLVGNPKRKV
jgi:hypothetical protein